MRLGWSSVWAAGCRLHNMFRTLLCSSSGARDYDVDHHIFHVSRIRVKKFLFENRTVCEIMWENIVEPDGPHDDTAHAHCMLDN